MTAIPTSPSSTARQLSLLTPSGHLTLGNYLGALRTMVSAQDSATCFFGISELHAMTTTHHPRTRRETTRELQTLLLAYLLECTAYVGELGRMIQFKEKRNTNHDSGSSTRASLFTYRGSRYRRSPPLRSVHG